MDKKELISLSEITDVTLSAVDSINSFVTDAYKIQSCRNPFANIERVDFIDTASLNAVRLLDNLKELIMTYRFTHGYTIYTE